MPFRKIPSMKKSFFLLLAISLVWSCAPKKYSAIMLPETDYVNLDTVTVSARCRILTTIVLFATP
jgi:hypothetical protein